MLTTASFHNVCLQGSNRKFNKKVTFSQKYMSHECSFGYSSTYLIMYDKQSRLAVPNISKIAQVNRRVRFVLICPSAIFVFFPYKDGWKHQPITSLHSCGGKSSSSKADILIFEKKLFFEEFLAKIASFLFKFGYRRGGRVQFELTAGRLELVIVRLRSGKGMTDIFVDVRDSVCVLVNSLLLNVASRSLMLARKRR